MALVVLFMEVMEFQSERNANQVCGSMGYDQVIRYNLNSVYCAKWINITFAGIKGEIRQDDIYYNIDGKWTLIESFQHGIGEIGRDELMN